MRRRYLAIATVIPAVVLAALGVGMTVSAEGQSATPWDGSVADVAARLLAGASPCLERTEDVPGTDGPEACLADELRAVAQARGLDVARQVMDEVAKDPQVGGCHFLSHAIGHVAAETLPLTEIAKSGFLHCYGGFYDGAVMALADMDAGVDDATFLRHTVTLCQGAGSVEPLTVAFCAHGAGHALVTRHGRDYAEALEACAQLDDTPLGVRGYSIRASCVGGAVMEFRAAPGEAVPGAVFSTEICRGLAGTSLDQCVEYTGVMDVSQRDGDVGAYLRWCATDPDFAATDECFARAGVWAYLSGQAEVGVPECMLLAGAVERRESCAYGYATGPYTVGAEWTPAGQVDSGCREFPEFCAEFTAIRPALDERFDGSDAPASGSMRAQ